MLGCVSIIPAIIFAFTVTGSTNPNESYSFEDKLNTDLLETFSVLLVSLISFANESDRLSLCSY